MNNINYNQLFEEIKSSHTKIVSVLLNIDNCIRSYPEVKRFLTEMENVLFYHFSLQNEELFGDIRAALSWSKDELAIIDFFIVDTRDLKVKTLGFFDEFALGMVAGKESMFIARFTDFSGIIRQRISSEKKYLLKYMEKIIGDNRTN